jgi:AAA ATPase domain
MEPTTLAERMSRRDREAFVGRERELRVVDALFADDPPASVLLVHGPAGIGKSVLLREIARRGRRAGWTAIGVDGRALDPAPAALADYLLSAWGLERPLVLIDGYERICPLGGYLRRVLVPSLPVRAVVVIAGRRPPTRGWFEGGWETMVAEMALGPLALESSRIDVPRAVREALRGLHVPSELARNALARGHGVVQRAASVRDLIGEATEHAFGETHDERLLKLVLVRGYVDPAPSHEQAAYELHMSRSTYFRRLRIASDRIAAYLSAMATGA